MCTVTAVMLMMLTSITAAAAVGGGEDTTSSYQAEDPYNYNTRIDPLGGSIDPFTDRRLIAIISHGTIKPPSLWEDWGQEDQYYTSEAFEWAETVVILMELGVAATAAVLMAVVGMVVANQALEATLEMLTGPRPPSIPLPFGLKPSMSSLLPPDPLDAGNDCLAGTRTC